MEITMSNMEYLIDLFDRYKDKLYITMRKNKYPIDIVLDFISGYGMIVERMKNIYFNSNLHYTIFNTNINELEKNNIVYIHNYFEATVLFADIMKYMSQSTDHYQCNKWIKNGIRYAICLANFYSENILFGDYTEVSDKTLYINIPDKNDPDYYDWKSVGYIYDL